MIVKSMEESDRRFSDAAGLLKTWMPWRSEPAHVSMDFWVPDDSCRVCYECDSEFNLFNRRHHCRFCGRIFCAKCSSIWLPSEDRNRIRVCNYCFTQCEVSKSLRSSPLQNTLNIQISEDAENEASSSVYETEDVDIEPIDFENSGLMWIPPEPEDAEDEMEAVMLEEDDSDERESDGYNIDANANVSNLTSSQTDGAKTLDKHLSLKEEFTPSPSDQSILVSSSLRCVWRGSLCERFYLRIKYYGKHDKPLGRFLQDQLFDQNFVCYSCEMPMEAHVLCYTHLQGTLTISVKKLPLNLPGEREGEIWVWHRCLRCPRTNGFPPATRRVLMSDAAWGLSFGKLLELSFSNHATASKVVSCGHSLSRDGLRFYGYGQMVACFRYESTDVYSVYLPPAKLDFTHKNQEWIEKEINEVVRQAECLFSEVLKVLNALRLQGERKRATKVPKSRHLITDIEGLLQKEKSIFEKSLQNILKKEEKIGQPLIDILELNRLQRELVFQSYVWDWRLRNAAGIGVPKKCSVSELAEATSSTVKVFNKLDKEDDRENSPSVTPPQSSSYVEDTENWLTTPFSVYYRSSNKDCSWPDLKLDILSGYNPVYISLFKYPELHGGARLLLPTGVNDIVIPVYDDELTSLISYALVSHDYFSQCSDELYGPEDTADSVASMNSIDTKALHARVSFTGNGKVKYTVTCYYAKHFEALRSNFCPTELDFVRSLSRCKKWRAQGGDSNVSFAKTLDDRFIIKQVTKSKFESFMKFAPAYFTYISESMGEGTPTCLAKILGIYQLSSKYLKGGKETKMDVLVMENLLFRRNITRLYDLKGSSSRYNPNSSGSNKVLLDHNLIEAMATSPILVGDKANRVLQKAVWNDTAFLASIDVMDYSLLVGVDEEKQELVVGMIDFMRQFTWDKQLESWVKAWGIFLGGRKNASPTVISPNEYKKRFRKAITKYFLMVPHQR